MTSGQWQGPVADADADILVLASRESFSGRVWNVRSDTFMFAGDTVTRNYVAHPGGVGVIALDDDDQVLLIRQYRHPVGRYLFEPPAGLLDVDDESALVAVQRELLEEAGYVADQWWVLVDFLNSPGGSSEAFRTFLARGLKQVAREYEGTAEEREMPIAWVRLDQARDLVLSGELQNPTAVSGVLAAWVSRSLGWSNLRPADAPWPIHDRVVKTGHSRTT